MAESQDLEKSNEADGEEEEEDNSDTSAKPEDIPWLNDENYKEMLASVVKDSRFLTFGT